ncbi:P-loop containing nucleoside triphosphate hydrolase protein [Trichocladium antarcticum]|uniref:P-loop containing nucleoside triphosphate hydrolase protein n=1 Tax=Trichocladium antarcticum TaxID=1450529 RepID=A0AAN6ZAR9_9PEZI|nr:P-loop containing nucleoside triphosphate hydrolase protein [Trichocladium antarcticum]
MAAPAIDPPPLQTRMVDDKSPICIPFILARIREHRKQHAADANPRPFIVGLNGVQGVGKTTLVRALAETLQEREGLPTLVASIDDFYLTHADQLALAAAHPDNALVQHRGEPGTHDLALLDRFLAAVLNHEPTPLPRYSKAAFSGLGDRLPRSTWAVAPPVSVLILEGWCIGFRPRPRAAVEAQWSSPRARTLRHHKLDHLLFLNDRLRDYETTITRRLDAFIHIDAAATDYVYGWRLQQEAQLRRESGGRAMTDEQVVRFVDAYYPAYELFTEGVRAGIFLPERPGAQLRLVVGEDRRVVEQMVL